METLTSIKFLDLSVIVNYVIINNFIKDFKETFCGQLHAMVTVRIIRRLIVTTSI